MTKSTALYKILQFGRDEQHNFIAAGKRHEAYQIETARNDLLSILMHSGIKGLRRSLPAFYEFTIDDKGFWHYQPFRFVTDEYTRNLVKDFSTNF